MSKVVFVCDKNLVALFESFGIGTFVLKENDNVKTILEELIGKGYRIIYILEKFAAKALGEIDAIIKINAASIVVVPDHLSKLDLGMRMVKQAAIDAVGTDAIFTPTPMA